MSMRSWLSRCFRSTPTRRRVARPSLEILEDRTVPTTFIVNNFTDTFGATGTLRDAIDRANNNPGLDAIVFRDSAFGLLTRHTISLHSTLVIRDAVSINGTVGGFSFPGFPTLPATPAIEIDGPPTNSS